MALAREYGMVCHRLALVSSVSSLSLLFLFLPCPSLSAPLLSLVPRFSGRGFLYFSMPTYVADTH